jgi:hypothetical protein
LHAQHEKTAGMQQSTVSHKETDSEYDRTTQGQRSESENPTRGQGCLHTDIRHTDAQKDRYIKTDIQTNMHPDMHTYIHPKQTPSITLEIRACNLECADANTRGTCKHSWLCS